MTLYGFTLEQYACIALWAHVFKVELKDDSDLLLALLEASETARFRPSLTSDRETLALLPAAQRHRLISAFYSTCKAVA